ncbi:DUF2769 domain-containing protein [Methanobacterium sp.]|uniref:DUF2769 domain-containing protein n=1 Tax=Methanobacterium sp. TaxID=2164 RepID=UPI003C73F6D4
MKFEDLQDELNKMNIPDRDKLIADLKRNCICHECPTYNNCTRKSKELLFCILGESGCPMDERICLCPKDCNIYQKYDLKLSFYCSRGEELERRDELYTINI